MAHKTREALNPPDASEDSLTETEEPQANSVLSHYAYRSLAFAERFLEACPPSHQQAGRWFHTALVFLDVLKAGSPSKFTEDLERVRQYAYTKTRMYSQLLGNLVPLYADKDVREIYEFEDDKPPLGQGSYGIVIKATHKQTRQAFACKILYVNRASVNSAKEVTKLHSEVSIMRELDHPNIVRLREVFYLRKRIYLLMDLCTGGNLLDYMKKHPNSENAESMAKGFLRQMLYAVKYLHDHQVVHRDLKLENWLLQSPTQNTLKLIDFGLSKFFHKNELMVQSVGSLYYVAPEVLENSYSEACDLWSIGVIAYMLLFGRPPFWGNNNDVMRQRIKTVQYSFPTDVKVSSGAIDFVQRLLVKDVAHRMTAEQALNHPWIHEEVRGASSVGTVPTRPHVEAIPRSQVYSSLLEFSDFNSLRRLILEVLAFNLTPMRIHHLGDVFRELDKQQKGTISLQNLKDYLQTNQSELSIPEDAEGEINSVYTALTKNSVDREINYNEFVAAVMWRRIQYDEEKMRMVFEALDVNRQGYLTAESIRQVVGISVDEDEIQRTVVSADQDGDGRINYSDFATLWKQHVIECQYTPLVKKLQKVKLLVRAARAFSSGVKKTRGDLGLEIPESSSSRPSSPSPSTTPTSSSLMHLATVATARTTSTDNESVGTYVPVLPTPRQLSEAATPMAASVAARNLWADTTTVAAAAPAPRAEQECGSVGRQVGVGRTWGEIQDTSRSPGDEGRPAKVQKTDYGP